MGKMNLAWSSTMKKKEPSNNNKEADSSSGGDHDAADDQLDHDQSRGRRRRRWLWSRRRSGWVFSATSAFMMKWKGLDFHLQLKIIDKLVFRVLYVVEAVVLVSTLCFFYLCCGCHI